MRLTEQRIQAMASEALERLEDEGVLEISGVRQAVRTELERVILADMKTYEEIEKEAKAFIGRMKKAPPEGSPEYEAILLKQKEEMAKRRNYVL